MKKIAILFLALIALVLGGCGSNSKDYSAVYTAAMKKQQEATSVDMSIGIKYPDLPVFAEINSMASGGMTMDIKMVDFKISDLDMLEGYYKLDAGFFSAEMYMKDGFMYAETFGAKIKTPFDYADASIPDPSVADDFLADDESFKKFTATENGNTLTLVLDLKTKAEVAAFLEDGSGIADSSLTQFGDGIALTSLRMEYVIDMNAESFTDINIDFGLEDSSADKTGVMNLNIHVNAVENVVIDYPDFSDYVEITE